MPYDLITGRTTDFNPEYDNTGDDGFDRGTPGINPMIPHDPMSRATPGTIHDPMTPMTPMTPGTIHDPMTPMTPMTPGTIHDPMTPVVPPKPTVTPSDTHSPMADYLASGETTDAPMAPMTSEPVVYQNPAEWAAAVIGLGTSDAAYQMLLNATPEQIAWAANNGVNIQDLIDVYETQEPVVPVDPLEPVVPVDPLDPVDPTDPYLDNGDLSGAIEAATGDGGSTGSTEDVYFRYANIPLFKEAGWKMRTGQNDAVNSITGERKSASEIYSMWITETQEGAEWHAIKTGEKEEDAAWDIERNRSPYGDPNDWTQEDLENVLDDPVWGLWARQLLSDPREQPTSLMGVQNSIKHPELIQGATNRQRGYQYAYGGGKEAKQEATNEFLRAMDTPEGKAYMTEWANDPENYDTPEAEAIRNHALKTFYETASTPEGRKELTDWAADPENAETPEAELIRQADIDTPYELAAAPFEGSYMDTVDINNEMTKLWESGDRDSPRLKELEAIMQTRSFVDKYVSEIGSEGDTDVQAYFNTVHGLFFSDPEEFKKWSADNPVMALRFHALAATGKFGTNDYNWGEEQGTWNAKKHQDYADAYGYNIGQSMGYGDDQKDNGQMIATNYDGKVSKDVNNPYSGGDFYKIGTPQKITDGIRNYVVDNPVQVALMVAAAVAAGPIMGAAAVPGGAAGTGLIGTVQLATGLTGIPLSMASVGIYTAGVSLTSDLLTGNLTTDSLMKAVKAGTISAATAGLVQVGAEFVDKAISAINIPLPDGAANHITSVALKTIANGGDPVAAVQSELLEYGVKKGVEFANGIVDGIINTTAPDAAEMDLQEVDTDYLNDIDLKGVPTAAPDPQQQLITDLGNGDSGMLTPNGLDSTELLQPIEVEATRRPSPVAPDPKQQLIPDISNPKVDSILRPIDTAYLDDVQRRPAGPQGLEEFDVFGARPETPVRNTQPLGPSGMLSPTPGAPNESISAWMDKGDVSNGETAVTAPKVYREDLTAADRADMTTAEINSVPRRTPFSNRPGTGTIDGEGPTFSEDRYGVLREDGPAEMIGDGVLRGAQTLDKTGHTPAQQEAANELWDPKWKEADIGIMKADGTEVDASDIGSSVPIDQWTADEVQIYENILKNKYGENWPESLDLNNSAAQLRANPNSPRVSGGSELVRLDEPEIGIEVAKPTRPIQPSSPSDQPALPEMPDMDISIPDYEMPEYDMDIEIALTKLQEPITQKVRDLIDQSNGAPEGGGPINSTDIDVAATEIVNGDDIQIDSTLSLDPNYKEAVAGSITEGLIEQGATVDLGSPNDQPNIIDFPITGSTEGTGPLNPDTGILNPIDSDGSGVGGDADDDQVTEEGGSPKNPDFGDDQDQDPNSSIGENIGPDDPDGTNPLLGDGIDSTLNTAKDIGESLGAPAGSAYPESGTVVSTDGDADDGGALRVGSTLGGKVVVGVSGKGGILVISGKTGRIETVDEAGNPTQEDEGEGNTKEGGGSEGVNVPIIGLPEVKGISPKEGDEDDAPTGPIDGPGKGPTEDDGEDTGGGGTGGKGDKGDTGGIPREDWEIITAQLETVKGVRYMTYDEMMESLQADQDKTWSF